MWEITADDSLRLLLFFSSFLAFFWFFLQPSNCLCLQLIWRSLKIKEMRSWIRSFSKFCFYFVLKRSRYKRVSVCWGRGGGGMKSRWELPPYQGWHDMPKPPFFNLHCVRTCMICKINYEEMGGRREKSVFWMTLQAAGFDIFSLVA